MSYCRLLIATIFTSIVLLIFVYKYFINDISHTLKIATGRETGGYYHFAKQYQENLQKDGISLEIVQTAGSVEALSLLEKGEVDLAFIQGGTARGYQQKGFESLASLFYEPLWVFYNASLTINYLTDLKGKRVSIGENGSGTKAMFETLFAQNGISTSELLNLSNYEAINQLKNNQLDAICLVISPESMIIKELLNNKDIKLMNFHRKLAYKDKYDFIDSVNLSEGVIDLEKNIPHEDVNLLATTASLVVRKSFNNNLQRLIVKNIKDIHKSGGIFEPKNYFPSINYVELPISEHTKAYLIKGETWAEKYLPFWFSSLVEALLVVIVPLIPILIIFIKIVLPSYSLYFKHKIYLWENQIYLVDREINTENITLDLLEKIEEIKRSIKRSCIIYFFYTHIYYDLLLKLDAVKDKVLHKQMIDTNWLVYRNDEDISSS